MSVAERDGVAPRCFPWGASRRLWSLWALLEEAEFSGFLEAFFVIASVERDLCGLFDNPDSKLVVVPSATLVQHLEKVRLIHRTCLLLGLRASASSAARLENLLAKKVDAGPIDAETAAKIEGVLKHGPMGQVFIFLKSDRLSIGRPDLCFRLKDEMQSMRFFTLSAADEVLYDDENPFGEKVTRAFPSAEYDIEEASKCLAIGRSTACVFHLMRALEVAASVVANKIGAAITDQYERGLPWGIIASNMKPIIDKMTKGSEEQAKWYRVHMMLESVGRAWRNPTAHPKKTYTVEEARRVFYTAKSFIQELAPLI